jgi:hypothetical protein
MLGASALLQFKRKNGTVKLLCRNVLKTPASKRDSLPESLGTGWYYTSEETMYPFLTTNFTTASPTINESLGGNVTWITPNPVVPSQ